MDLSTKQFGNDLIEVESFSCSNCAKSF